MLETKPLELIYQGPTNISQVLSPFSASPPAVLLSGFRSRCHIVIKGAFPTSRVQQGLTQLIHLYTRAGFPKEELQTISDQLMIQHQNLPSQSQTEASCLHFHVLLWFPWCVWPLSFSCFFLSPWLCLLLLLLLLCCVSLWFFLAASWLNFARSFLLLVTFLLMDHAQARAFHHHLARALMHLNYLAGLLPFFEWEDPLPPQNLRLENMRSRSLHTFVPLPPASASPTLVTHGGIPSHMVENPESNLRPTTLRPPTHMERDHPSTNPVGVHNPILMSDPNPTPEPFYYYTWK